MTTTIGKITGMALMAIIIYALASFAFTGGVWVATPTDDLGSDHGAWLISNPNVDPHHNHDHLNSESYAYGSVGRLQSFGADDNRSSICDNNINGKDAAQQTSNGNGRSSIVRDNNGVAGGCGVDILGYNADFHTAVEAIDPDGDWHGIGGTSKHFE